MASRKSQRLRRDSSLKAELRSEDQAASQDEKLVRRRATVYDAVAGRVTGRLIKTNPSRTAPTSPPAFPPSRVRDAAREPPLAPEEVLFRRKDAPPRYAEKDVYFAGTDALAAHDGNKGRLLPASDVLKAVHGYAAGFYEAAAAEREAKGRAARLGGRLADERSMDETALLAFGVLLEEAAREALGKNGDLVFTEGVGKDARSGEEGKVGVGSGTEGGDLTPRSTPAKRRKLSHGSASA